LLVTAAAIASLAHLEQAIKHAISSLKETKDHILRRNLLGELGLQSAEC
jgi:hypothetical protein